jgi:hypothetical protein
MAQSLPTAKMPQTPQQKEQRTTTESSSLLRKTRFYLKDMKKFKPIDHRLKQKFKKYIFFFFNGNPFALDMWARTSGLSYT